MWCRARVLPCLVLSLAGAGAGALGAQGVKGAGAQDVQGATGALAGRVMERESGAPLPYSIVELPALSPTRERFTDDSGAFRLTALPVGSLAIRVRRLGFAPADVVVPVRAGVTDTVVIALRRVAVRLPRVVVRDIPPCRDPGAPDARVDSALAHIFEQLRLNAQQYRLLSEQYPFAYEMELVLERERRNGSRVVVRDRLRETSSDRRAYAPGRVVTPARGQLRRHAPYEFHVPELADFASDAFVRHHCFHRGGMEGDSLVLIEVRAAEWLPDADVDGTIALDAATFQIRRTRVRMSRVPRYPGFDAMLGQEVTTSFREVLPSIPVIDSVHSVQRFDRRAFDVRYVTVYETQKLAAFEFLEGRPGGTGPP